MTLTHLRRHDPACSQALLSAGKVMICWPIKPSEKNRSFNDPALWWFALDWLNFLCYHLAWHFKWLLLLYRRQISARDRTGRLRVVPHFSSGTVERAKRERAGKSPHARKGDTRRGERKMIIFLSPRHVSIFLAWDDFHARSRFALSTIPEEKWGTTRSLSELPNSHFFY